MYTYHAYVQKAHIKFFFINFYLWLWVMHFTLNIVDGVVIVLAYYVNPSEHFVSLHGQKYIIGTFENGVKSVFFFGIYRTHN